MYKISIIIPVFNVEDKIKRSFESILNQTFDFEELEVIYVDDCSTDDSAKIIRNISKSYSNVKLIILDENSGYAGKPRNVGIKHATADYLMFLDPDDIFLENACEILYDNIKDTNLDLVSGNFLTTSLNKTYKINWNNINLKDGYLQVNSLNDQPELLLLPPSVWSKIFKKDFVLNNNIFFPVGIPAQDMVFVYHALLKSNGIKYIDIPVVKYMPGQDETKNKSVTSTRTKNSLFGLLKAYYFVLDLFKNKDDLKGYVAIHLNFWVKQLVISKISLKDKVTLLRYAYPIFVIFKNEGDLHIRGGFGPLFNKVYNKDFIGAANLSELAAMNLDENYFNIYAEIKTRKIFILFDDYEFVIKNANNFVNLLNNGGYSVEFINLGSYFDYLNNHSFNNNFINHNIYDYYSKEFNIGTNCKNSFNQSKKELFAKKDEITNDDFLVKYYNVTSLDECDKNNLVMEELYISNCLVMSNKFENGNKIYEKYFTPDGFNYLEITNEIKLKNRFNNLYITFYNINDFYNYFIEDITLKLEKKPFLINYMNNFDFNDSSELPILKIFGENFNLFNLKDMDAILRDTYIDEVIKIQSIPLENNNLKNKISSLENSLNSYKQSNKKLKKNLKDTRRKLKNSNKKFRDQKEKNLKSEQKLKDKLNKSQQKYEEIISSKSWKITKPLRYIMRLFG